MANPFSNDPIPVELDKPRSFKFDINAHTDFNDTTGLELFEVFRSMAPTRNPDGTITPGQIPTINVLRAIVWAALIHEERDDNGRPKLKLHHVGSWLTLDNFRHIAADLGRAFTQYIPKPDPNAAPQEAPADGASPSTGAESTAPQNNVSESSATVSA